MNVMGTVLVILQLAGIGLTGYAALSRPAGSYWFLLLSLGGTLFGLYTLLYNRPGNFSIHPRPLRRARLITSGPYRFIRHPIYLSVFLFLLGLALYAGHPAGWVGVLVTSAAMAGKMQIEERYLAERFPEYTTYRSHTWRLIPFIY